MEYLKNIEKLVEVPNIVEVLSLKKDLSNEGKFVALLLKTFDKEEVKRSVKKLGDNIRHYEDDVVSVLTNILTQDIYLKELRDVKNYLSLKHYSTILHFCTLYEAEIGLEYKDILKKDKLLCSNVLNSISEYHSFRIEGLKIYNIPTSIRFKLFLLNYYIPLKCKSFEEKDEDVFITFDNMTLTYTEVTWGTLDLKYVYITVGDKRYNLTELDKLIKENNHLLRDKYKEI